MSGFLFDQTSINVFLTQFPISHIANKPAATQMPPETMGSVTEGKSEWKETAG